MRSFLIFTFTIVIFPALIFSNIANADNYSDTINLFKKSPAVQSFFNNSYGYVVFPTIGKAGFVIGGAYGEGLLYHQEISVGTVTMMKATVGFQAGGQAFSEIIFLQDKRAYDEFTSGNFEFDASASAVVITAGIQAKTGTNGLTASVTAGPATGAQAETNYRKGMAVFIHTKGGLMYEATVGGQKFSYESIQ